MSLLDFFKGERSAPAEFKADPDPIDPSSTLHIAVLAVRYGGKNTVLQWAWAANCEERFALGAALKSVGDKGVIVGKTVIQIPVASGTEAGTGETEGLDPKDDGPVGEAETPNPHRDSSHD